MQRALTATFVRPRATRLFAAPCRPLASAVSPFATPEPSGEQQQQQGLSREEEQKERIQAMEKLMREKTMREVNAAAAARRPDGISHVIRDDDKKGQKKDVDEAIAKEFGRQYAADYSEDRDEWGGPKGKEPTRFGDWEQKGRATDF